MVKLQEASRRWRSSTSCWRQPSPTMITRYQVCTERRAKIHKAGEECMNTESTRSVFQVISPSSRVSTHLHNSEHPQCEDFPFLNIVSHPWCQHCTPGARSYRDCTPFTHTRLKSWIQKNIGAWGFLRIDCADLCGLSMAEWTGSLVFHTL